MTDAPFNATLIKTDKEAVETPLRRMIPKIVEGLPVVLVTGYPTLMSAIDSIELPVVAYLVKPIEFPQLVAKVQGAIPRFRMFRTVKRFRKELLDFGQQLDGVESELGRPPDAQSPGPVHDFVALSFEGITRALRNLRDLTESVALQSPTQAPCEVLNCPRGRRLTDAIKDGVRILEKTKKSFKSKELAQMREDYETLLRELG
jgi:hypothetical protein